MAKKDRMLNNESSLNPDQNVDPDFPPMSRLPGTQLLDDRELERQIEDWKGEWSRRGLEPIQSIAEILALPKRFARLCINLSVFNVTRFPVILFDKATGELIEVRVRGVKLLNKLSLAGVDYVIVTRAADEWARTRVSGRVVKANGTVLDSRL